MSDIQGGLVYSKFGTERFALQCFHLLSGGGSIYVYAVVYPSYVYIYIYILCTMYVWDVCMCTLQVYNYSTRPFVDALIMWLLSQDSYFLIHVCGYLRPGRYYSVSGYYISLESALMG